MRPATQSFDDGLHGALSAAAKRGDAAEAARLIDLGASPTASSGGSPTAFYWACHEGHLSCLEIFLTHPSCGASHISSGMGTCAHHGRADCLAALMRRVDDPQSHAEAAGWAVRSGNVNCVRLFCGEPHARVLGSLVCEAVEYAGLACLEAILPWVDGAARARGAAFAAANGNVSALKLCLPGADFGSGNLEMLAIRQSARTGHLDCLRLLAQTIDLRSFSCLESAVFGGSPACVAFVAPFEEPTAVEVALRLAVRDDKDDCVAALLCHGAVPDTDRLERWMDHLEDESPHRSARSREIIRSHCETALLRQESLDLRQELGALCQHSLPGARKPSL